MIFVSRNLRNSDEGIYIEKDQLLSPRLIMRGSRLWLAGSMPYMFAVRPPNCGGWLDCSDVTEGPLVTVLVLKSKSNNIEYCDLRQTAEKSEFHPEGETH